MIRRVVLTALAGMIVAGAPARGAAEDAAMAPTAEKPWKNETELSAVSANGNTRSTTSSGKNTFTYNWTRLGLELIAGALGSKSDGSVTAERYFASEKMTFNLTERNYVYEKFAWDKDRFAGIRDRYDASLGVGRDILKSERNLFLAELGHGYIQEDRIGSPDVDFASGRAYLRFEHKISGTSSFLQDAEYLANFEDSDDFRTKTETALIAALSAHFSLKVSYVWRHSGAPPAGFGRNDTLTSVALLAVY